MTATETRRELTPDQIRSQFGGLITLALTEIRRDGTYITDMAERASLILYKRRVWEVRTEINRAEKDARNKCELDDGKCPFTCTNDGPCGFGRCRFATPDHARMKAPQSNRSDGRRGRPCHDAKFPTYRTEDLITFALKSRGVAAPATLSQTRHKD